VVPIRPSRPAPTCTTRSAAPARPAADLRPGLRRRRVHGSGRAARRPVHGGDVRPARQLAQPSGRGAGAPPDRGPWRRRAPRAVGRRRLRDEPASVFGNSSGAIIGLELAARHPEQVRVLVAHEPPLFELLRIVTTGAPSSRTWRTRSSRRARARGSGPRRRVGDARRPAAGRWRAGGGRCRRWAATHSGRRERTAGGARPGDDGDDGAPAEEHGVLHRPRGAAVRQVRPRFRGPPGVLGAGRGGRGRRDGRRAAAWPRPPSPPIVAGTYPIPRSVRPRMPEAPSEHPGAGGAVTRVRTLRSEADRREVDVALDRDRRVDVHGVGREVNA